MWLIQVFRLEKKRRIRQIIWTEIILNFIFKNNFHRLILTYNNIFFGYLKTNSFK